MKDELKDKYIKHIDRLINLSKSVRASCSTDVFTGDVELDMAGFTALEVGATNLIARIEGENGRFYKNFIERVSDTKQNYPARISAVTGILSEFKKALESDLLDDVEDLMRAEVFKDFLEMAQHLLKTGYIGPAVVLVGGVLENGLKKLAKKNSIAFEENDGIGPLNISLARAKVYTKLKQQQIQAWGAIRNSAAHGDKDEYNPDDVKYMLEGVRMFISEYLG